MTKKKRARKEQHHHKGNPPPASFAPRDPAMIAPDDSAFFDDDLLDDLDDLDSDLLDSDLLDEFNALSHMDVPPAPDYALRPMERSLMRLQRYLAREGIVVMPENQQDIEELLAEGAWQKEPDVLNTALDRAQALIYDAFELPEDAWERRIPLAKQALRISQNCADAHTLLAELESPTEEAELHHFRDAAKAADRAFRDVDATAGPRDFWHLLTLRPLLRALSGLADAEAVAGNNDRALAAYRRLFEIDHLDVMTRREAFIGLLMVLELDEEVIRLYERLGRIEHIAEESAHLQYSLALTRFRLEGDSPAAVAALASAIDGNAAVARYLLGVERVHYESILLPGIDPVAGEAAQYYMNDCRLWLRTPNAIEWLRGHAGDSVRAG